MMFETCQKPSYSCNFILIHLKPDNFLSRRKRSGITIEITQDFICIVANLKRWLQVHYKYFNTMNTISTINTFEMTTLKKECKREKNFVLPP